VSNAVLSAERLNVGYGPQRVLFDLEFKLGEKEICGVIGPNGAGKSTLLKALYGLIKSQSGKVSFQSDDLTSTSVRARIERGISFVPQERSVFPNLTVEENLNLALDSLPSGRSVDRAERIGLAFSLFPRLKERRQQLAGTMSGGEQRMVAISIGLMPQPKVLMLDEPTTGLAPQVVHNLMDVIKKLNKEFGIATIVVEQNILSTAKIADRMYILKSGRGSSFEGCPQQLTKQQILECL
jgi:branched-chain amino acid transport system ATP-binding protein